MATFSCLRVFLKTFKVKRESIQNVEEEKRRKQIVIHQTGGGDPWVNKTKFP